MVAHNSRPYGVRQQAVAPASLDSSILACVLHGAAPKPGDDPRMIAVNLPLLHGPAAELWHSPMSVDYGWDHGMGFAGNGQVLFGHLRLPEPELLHMDRAVFHAYAIIDSLLRRHGYPAWLRMWNYLSDINQGEGDAERYRQFVLGRYKALALKHGFEKDLPAATAIGARGGGMLIYFLAGRAPGFQIENPRQVSAFQYPRQYGPRSPSFSRAMLMPWSDQWEMLISGTASVVGHETLHAGAPLRQLQESAANVQALLEQAQARHCPGAAWEAQGCKLYLRSADVAQAAAAVDVLAARVPRARIVALHGDICRSDLAVEMDAHYTASIAPATTPS